MVCSLLILLLLTLSFNGLSMAVSPYKPGSTDFTLGSPFDCSGTESLGIMEAGYFVGQMFFLSQSKYKTARFAF